MNAFSEKYGAFFTKEYMMGPNTLRLLDEMLGRYPLEAQGRVLDLGCGTGLSSMFLAKETGAQVFAVDLWCSATDNYRRFCRWNVEKNTVPVHADANDLPFAEEYFDAVVSVDAYHYFACDGGFFQKKLLPLVKKGGWVLIVVPGLREEFGEEVPAEMLEWAGEEYRLFHSCAWWKETIGECAEIAQAEFFEMDCADEAWREWFESGHEYALRDKEFFERGVGKYMNFVGMAIRRSDS